MKNFHPLTPLALALVALCVAPMCTTTRTVTRTVYVPSPKQCKLPPIPDLPRISTKPAVINKHICFTVPDAQALTEREQKLKQWVKETVARCKFKKKDASSARSPDAGARSESTPSPVAPRSPSTKSANDAGTGTSRSAQ